MGKKEAKIVRNSLTFIGTRIVFYILFIILVLATIVLVIWNLNPQITGAAVYDSFSTIQKQNLTVNSSSEYLLELEPDIVSFYVSGSITGKGSAKIYIMGDSQKKLVLDASSLEPPQPSYSITKPSPPRITANETIGRGIRLDLAYKSLSPYDNNDDGIETEAGIVDLTVENTMFNWPVDEARLCSIWDVYSEEHAESTLFCNGNEVCCNLYNMTPTSREWNSIIYLYKGAYGTTSNNIVSAEIKYVDYNLSLESPFAELHASESKSLQLSFTERIISFERECAETCYMQRINTSSIRMIVDVSDAVLHLSDIYYTTEKPRAWINIPPISTKEIPQVIIYKNEEKTLNLSEFFYDPDSPALNYTILPVEGITSKIEGSILTLTPRTDITGLFFTFVASNDSASIAIGNIFNITVIEKPIIRIEENLTQQPLVILGKPVKWTKKVSASNITANLTISLSEQASNISIKVPGKALGVEDRIKISYKGSLHTLEEYETTKKIERIDEKIQMLASEKKEKALDKAVLREINAEILGLKEKKGIITGAVVYDSGSKGFLTRFFEWLFIYFNADITGAAAVEIAEHEENAAPQVIIEDSVGEVELEYFTEGPYSEETILSSTAKQVLIASETHYENILAFTSIKDSRIEGIKIYWVKNDSREKVNLYEAIDTNNNSLIDEVYWLVPHLSNQTYEIIIRVKEAKHLDENRAYIEDIYEFVRLKDNNWSSEIPSEHYVRATFEKKLDSSKDITVFAKTNSLTGSTAYIEVYLNNSDNLITTISNISQPAYYKTYLTFLNGSHDTFDLKIKNSSIMFDEIVDPTSITTCQALNTANTEYSLSNDVTADGTCFTIGAHNITLDCNSNQVYYATTSGGYGVDDLLGYDNITIKNCDFVERSTSPGNYGLYFSTADNCSIINTNITTTNSGAVYIASGTNNTFIGGNYSTIASAANAIHAVNVDYTHIENLNLSTNASATYSIYISGDATDSTYNKIINNKLHAENLLSAAGIYLYGNTDYTLIANNTIYNSFYGVYYAPDTFNWRYTDSNNLSNNIISSNTADGYDFYASSGNDNWLIDQNIGRHYISGTMINIRNSSAGEIVYTMTGGIISMTSGRNFTGLKSSLINISNNSVSVDPLVEFNGLNKTANITLFGIGDRGFTNPILYRDNSACPASTCYNFTTLNAQTVIFNVTGFSNYSIHEGPLDTDITSCTNLGTSNKVYNLLNDVAEDGTRASCMNFTNDNITLNCNRYRITHPGGAGTAFGVFSENHENITILNCDVVHIALLGTRVPNIMLINVTNATIRNTNLSAITDYSPNLNITNSRNISYIGGNLTSSKALTYAVAMYYSENNYFTTLNASANYSVFHLIYTNSTSIIGNKVYRNSSGGSTYAFYLYGDSDNNVIANNTVYSGGYGAYITYDSVTLRYPNNNNLSANNFINSSQEDLSVAYSNTNHTWLVDQPLGIVSVTDSIIHVKNSSAGLIDFFYGINITSGNLSNLINITNNSISVYDSTGANGLNVSANITFYNMNAWSFSNPAILRNSLACVGCSNFTSLAANTVIFNVTGFSNYSIGENPGDSSITSCQTLSSPNTAYTLANDLTSASGCLHIMADNISLDCLGKRITHNTGGAGIGINVSNVRNITITNCHITTLSIGGYSDTVHALNATNVTITNTNITSTSNSGSGLNISSSSNISFIRGNITLTGNTYPYGVNAFGSKYNYIAYSNLSAGYYAVDIDESNFTTVYHNIIHNEATGQAINVYSYSHNNTISNNTFYNSGIIFLISVSNKYPANNTIMNNTFIPKGTTELTLDAGSNDTWIVDQELESIGISSSTIAFKNSSAGVIKFLQPVTVSGPTNLSNLINFSINFLSINANVSGNGLNKSAEITFFNITDQGFARTVILRNGKECAYPMCYNTTLLTASTVTFNVTGFTNYTIGQGRPLAELSECKPLDIPNTEYYMIQNISTTSGCFNISADNITLNCSGFNITYAPMFRDDAIIAENIKNLTIKDCVITENSNLQNSPAIRLVNVSNATLTNINITIVASLSAPAINITRASNVTYIGGNISTISYGIAAESSAYDRFEALTVSSSLDAFYLSNTNYSTVHSNRILTAGGWGAITLYGWSLNNTISNNTVLYAVTTAINLVYDSNYLSPPMNTTIMNNSLNSTTYDLDIAYAGANNTWLIDQHIEKHRIVSSIVHFKNSSAGQIIFLSNISSIQSGANLSTLMNITNNSISINTNPMYGGEIGLNISANISLYRLADPNIVMPKVLKDGRTCKGCYNFTSLLASTVLFNTTGFSSFRIGRDLTPPEINITWPWNTTYARNHLHFNVTTDNATDCFYSLNQTANVSMTYVNDTFFTVYLASGLSPGPNNVSVSCNNSLGNFNTTNPTLFYVKLGAPCSTGSACSLDIDPFWEYLDMCLDTNSDNVPDSCYDEYPYCNSSIGKSCDYSPSEKGICTPQGCAGSVAVSGEYGSGISGGTAASFHSGNEYGGCIAGTDGMICNSSAVNYDPTANGVCINLACFANIGMVINCSPGTACAASIINDDSVDSCGSWTPGWACDIGTAGSGFSQDSICNGTGCQNNGYICNASLNLGMFSGCGSCYQKDPCDSTLTDGNFNRSYGACRKGSCSLGSNNAPVINSVSLSTTYGSNQSWEDLNCYTNATDPDGDQVDATIRWFRNQIEYSGYTDKRKTFLVFPWPSLTGENSSVLADTLPNAYTEDGENWTCMVTVDDGSINATSWQNQTLRITGTLAVSCGNGVIQGSEQCDDGNTVSGDGCSASCNTEATGKSTAVAAAAAAPVAEAAPAEAATAPAAISEIEGVEIDTEGLVEAKALSEEEAVLTEEETEEVIKQETILEKQELIKDVEIPAGVMEEVAPAVTETAAGSRRAEEKTTVGKAAEIIAEKKEKPKEVAIDIPTPKEAVITDEPIVEDGETFYAETPKETAIGRLEKFDEKTEIKSLSESYISNLNSMPDSVSANLIQQLPREQKIEALQRLTLTEKKVEMIESLPSDDKISVLEKQEINDIAISIIKDLSKDERQKLISRLPLEKQIKLKNMLSGLIPTGAAVFEPGEISDEELRIDLAEDYAAGEKVLSCIKSTEKSDTQTVNIAASSSAVDMPEGFEQVIEPFKVSCIVNKTKISFNIPSRYEDLKIVECKGSSCSTKPVNEVEELTCGKKIKEVERKKDSFDVNDFPIKVQGMITQVTPGKNIVMSGRSKISFAGNIVADVILSKPKNSIKQPHNPKLKIMSTPLIALINSSSKDIGADITIPYADSEFIVKDSLAIYYWKNSQWNFLGGKIDYKARTVTAQVANISGVSEKNTLFVSVIGVLCTNCVESKLTKIFVPEKYTDKAVLLVHGFASSSKTYQQIVDDFRLTQQPYKVYIFDYLQNKSLDEIALELAILLEAKSDEFNELSIIGHSLGGLLAQRLVYLAEKANEELPGSYTFLPTIKRSFIIGAPNLGSPLARDYQKLFGILANKASEFSLLKVDSAIISILANGIITPRVKGIEYLVMAGTRDYELNLLLFQTSVSKYFPGLSDGVVGVNSARMVGEAYVPDLCSDYYEINVTHTDLLHKEESRQVIEKIITKAQESDIKAGQNKYIEIVIENCSPKIDYTIIGKVQHKQKQLDPTGCSCGNGFCGEGEDEVNCPSDCLNIVTKDSFCGVKKPVMMLFIIIIVMMLLLNIIIFSWKKRFPLTTTLIALASASLLAGVFIAGTIICDPKCSYIAEKIQLIIWALYFVSFFFVIASKITFHLPHGSLRTKLRILQSIISVLIIAAALIFVRAQIIILLLLALLSIISLYYSVKPEHISIASISRYAIRKTPSIKHWKIMLMVVVGIIASIIIAIIAQYVITKVSLSIPEKLPEFMPLLSESSLDEALSGLADITLGAIILLAVILFNEMLRRIKPPVQKPYEPAAPIAPEQPQKTLPKSVKCPLSIRLFLLKIRLQKIFGVYRGIGQLEYEIKARLGIWKPGSYPPSSGLNQRIFSIKIRLKKIFGIYISIEDLERLIKGRLERQKKK